MVFCDWLAWILRIKKSRRDDSLKSLLDKHQTSRQNSVVEDALSDTYLPINDRVFTAELFQYSIRLFILI